MGMASPRCLAGLGLPGQHPLPLGPGLQVPPVAKGALSIKTACGNQDPTEATAPSAQAVPWAQRTPSADAEVISGSFGQDTRLQGQRWGGRAGRDELCP